MTVPASNVLNSSFVDTPSAVDELVQYLHSYELIGLDTEGDNLHHYRTRVCLMQIGAGDKQFLVDTLANLDLAPLFSELATKRLILHGSDFDLRLLWEFARFRPAEIFDTMFAAQLLGHERIGLASLLEEFFGIEHPKGSQKSDWSRRPLTPTMHQYAASDVLHLFELHRVLTERLSALGRLEWHRQKCAWQIDAGSTGFPHDDDAWRIGASRRWPARAVAALYEIWHWREAEAERMDRPPFMVLSTDHIGKLSLAVHEGTHLTAFENLPESVRRRHSRGLMDAIERGVQRSLESLPHQKRHERPPGLSPAELARQDVIQKYRDQTALELKIDPTLIASRSQMAQISRRPQELQRILLPWQAELLSPALRIESNRRDSPAGS